MPSAPTPRAHPLVHPRLAVCGVFDGHAGRNAAEFVSTRLNDAVAPALLAACTHSGLPDARVKLDTKAARAAIVKGFADADAALLDTAREQGTSVLGCTRMY